ncbi:MAG: amidohydrolase family protein [Acidobacteriota bacterium]
MIKIWLAACICVALATLLSGCGGAAPDQPKVLIGATLFDTSNRSSVDRSVVVVEKGYFKAVGDQPTLPIPAGSEKIDLTGRFLIPTPIQLPLQANYPRFKTQDELRALVGSGKRVVMGTPVDTVELDAALIDQIKKQDILIFPSLRVFELEPHNLQRAKVNAKKMFDAGVQLGVDGDHNAHREWKFLSEAGFTADEIIQMTSANAAKATASRESGRIASGMQANLYVLKCDPREDISCLVKVERALVNGVWAQPPALGEN